MSILVSTILLAYSLTHFVSIPPLELNYTLFGILFPVQINFTTLVTLLIAGLTASGTAWLLQDHPDRRRAAATFVHWLLPTLTALVLMGAINQLPFNGTWWIAAVGSGALLVLVLEAEFIALEPAHRLYALAEMGISVLSIILFLILAISLHASETRLFYRVPALSLAAFLVYLRIVHLRQQGRWAVIPGSVSFLLIGEIGAVLHYWPMRSIGFGIALTGPLFALVELSDIDPGQELRLRAFLEPILILAISWGAALLL